MDTDKVLQGDSTLLVETKGKSSHEVECTDFTNTGADTGFWKGVVRVTVNY